MELSAQAIRPCYKAEASTAVTLQPWLALGDHQDTRSMEGQHCPALLPPHDRWFRPFYGHSELASRWALDGGIKEVRWMISPGHPVGLVHQRPHGSRPLAGGVPAVLNCLKLDPMGLGWQWQSGLVWD